VKCYNGNLSVRLWILNFNIIFLEFTSGIHNLPTKHFWHHARDDNLVRVMLRNTNTLSLLYLHYFYMLATIVMTILVLIIFMFLVIIFIIFCDYMLSMVGLSSYSCICLYSAHPKVPWVGGRHCVSVVLICCVPVDTPYMLGHAVDRGCDTPIKSFVVHSPM
jgi:hypothetical protein